MKFRLLRPFILFLFVYSVIRLFGYSTPAYASEGSALLSGQTDASCYFASVLIDENRYKIVAACRDLTVPPESETLYYRVWGKRLGQNAPTPGAKTSAFGRSAYLSLGDITSGKLAADAREPFDEILITAEKESNPSNPNLDKIILSGSIQPIDYGPPAGGAGVGETLKPTSPLARVTLEPTASPPPAGGSAVSSGKSVVGTAFRIFLTVLLIIVAIAVIISVIQRRSASK